MKEKLYDLFAALLIIASSISQVSAQDVKTAYAWAKMGTDGAGVYSFDMKADTVDNIHKMNAMSFDEPSGGYCLDDVLYYLDCTQNDKGYISKGFYSYDMKTGTLKTIKDYGATQNGPVLSHFAYDIQRKTMYGLSDYQSGYAISKINMEDGTILKVADITIDGMGENARNGGVDFQKNFVAIACNYDGDMYGVSYWGDLYKMNPVTGVANFIGSLDYNPDHAYMYNKNCLFFDNATGNMYFRFYTNNGKKYELAKIDINTAHMTHIATLPYAVDANDSIITGGDFDGIAIPFRISEASAPAKPQNLTITTGANGALSATLEWDNPSKTYGRNGTLEDLDSVIIYRDGIEIGRIKNPVIGGHETFTDQLDKRGYYTYRLVPVNDTGHGDRVSMGIYVGPADPKAVTDVTLKADGSNGILTWTAPTKGKLDGYINTADLKYDITRSDSVKIATDITATTFTDTTLPALGKYSYLIVAKAGGYRSDAALSETIILGPAIQVPDTLLTSQDNFNLWTIIDANGNGYGFTWSEPTDYSFGGAYIYYPYDEVMAADWLISPKIHLSASKHYKVTVQAEPGSKSVLETIAFSFGKGTEIANQDSIAQYQLQTDQPTTLRANLPAVATDGDYHFGFYYRTYYQNYSMYLKNAIVSENHDGYVSGVVTAKSTPIANANVCTANGQFVGKTDAYGSYHLDYLPEGKYHLNITALGYQDASVDVNITELDTTKVNVELTALPVYNISGTVKDVAGDPVSAADVDVTGYNSYHTTTAADGTFKIGNVYKNDNYYINVVKNKLLSHGESFRMHADSVFAITLEDNIKPARGVVVSVDSATMNAKVAWKAPANDAVEDRIDDGTITTSVGMDSPTSNCLFGVIRKSPATVEGVKFYIQSSTVSHYSVDVSIFGLDSTGLPDKDDMLYHNTNVPVTEDAWTDYTLPAPVDAPKGYYIALASSDYMDIGLDGNGDSKQYPFREGINCFTNDYTAGQWYFLEDQTKESLHHNFLIRPIAAPYAVPEDTIKLANKVSMSRFLFHKNTHPSIELTSVSNGRKLNDKTVQIQQVVRKALQQRVCYNLYRMKTSEKDTESDWTLISEKQKETAYTDTQWNGLQQDSYIYAVKTVYPGSAAGDQLSDAIYTDSIGNKMYTKVTFHISTNTPENEANGTHVVLQSNGGTHVAEGYADKNGDVVISHVWKTRYQVNISLNGFCSMDTVVVLDKADAYEYPIKLIENKIQPYNLTIEDVNSPSSKNLVWNYADYFEDGFENHSDFTINSPGTIGWQYIDGDGSETGAFTIEGKDTPWINAFSPMAYIVFNCSQVSMGDGYTIGDYYPTLLPHNGKKSLIDWAPATSAANDWIITPKLHFKDAIKFRFYASSYDPLGYPEQVEVLYSNTDAQPSSFIRIDSVSVDTDGWKLCTENIPVGAKYVAIRCVTPQDKGRALNIDDISYGLSSALPDIASNVSRKAAATQISRASASDGLYEVYLDGVKLASTNGTEYQMDNLSSGKHTAGVLASYTSGKTALSTIDFSIDLTGISTIASGNALTLTYADRVLTLTGQYESVQLLGMDGKQQPMNQTSAGKYCLTGTPSGVYIVNVMSGQSIKTMKIVVK